MKNDWPHAPAHRFENNGVYFVTGATLHKQHIYKDDAALTSLQALLFTLANAHNCRLQAWAIFSNHYHLVIEVDQGESLRQMLARLHSDAAKDANRRDGTPGRRVWFQFWDTQLTIHGSWLARLRYTHENAVHHGLARRGYEYRWCSARWFEEYAPMSFVRAVAGVQIGRVKVYDAY